MGHFYAPPPPIVSANGAQPYAPNKLPPAITSNPGQNPPFSDPGRWPQADPIIAAWQPPPPQPWQKGPLPPAITNNPGQNPPFAYLGRWPQFDPILRAWQPPDLLPQLPLRLVPIAAAVVVNNPPFSYLGRWPAFDPIIRAWQPPDLLPQLPKNLAPGIPGQSVDNPPPGSRVNLYVSLAVEWKTPDPLPQQLATLSPGIPGQSVDNPPFVRPFQSFDTPAFTLPQLPVRLAQAGTTIVVNNPPFSYPTRWPLFDPIIRAWQPADVLPQQLATLSPGIPGQSVDNPPPSSPANLYSALAATWKTPDPLPQQLGTLSPGIPGQSVDPPPPHALAGLYTNLWVAWKTPDPLPQQLNTLSPGIPGQSVDNPPFVRPFQSFDAASFQPSQPPQLPFLLPQGGVVNTPPFSSPGRWPLLDPILAAWQPGPPQPWQKGPLPPSLLDNPGQNPPFSSRSELPTILMAWQPPPPMPYPSVTIMQPQGGTAAPIIPGEFTVSGQDVVSLFGPIDGVSWEWGGGVQKRTT